MFSREGSARRFGLTLVREGVGSECAATFCNGRFRIGCFLIGCSAPRLQCGGITKLWFEVSVASLAFGSDAMSWGLGFGVLDSVRVLSFEF